MLVKAQIHPYMQITEPLLTGFSRTALRSSTTRTILGKRTITQHFHEEVAHLTAKVALLFKPLTDFLYSRPPKDGHPNRKIADQYQALHNIVSVAAYLSICIRLSPTIFFFSHASPNMPYDREDQSCVSMRAYNLSKRKVVVAYNKNKAAYETKKQKLQGAIDHLEAAGKSATSRVYRSARQKLDSHLRTRPPTLQSTYRALAKICIWPSITRYKPGTKEDDDAERPLEERDGFRAFEISKSGVACYYGFADRAQRAKTEISLVEFVKNKKAKFGKKEPLLHRRTLLAAVAAVTATAGIPYFIYGKGHSA